MSGLPPWRSPLVRALHRNRSLPHRKFVQLATVDQQGHPHNRTVVYRGLLDSTHQLKFVTDQRSDKISHLRAQPIVEICWYFTKTREQFRLSGNMQAIDKAKLQRDQSGRSLRLELWQQLSDHAQQQFYWPSPGAMRSPTAAFEEYELTSLPPDNFVLLLLTPTQVDHLQLRGNPQNRDRFTYESGEWIVEHLNP